MSSNESAAYEIMRSLDVDYVLIIFGGVIGYSGDDINKFLWMVRIAEGEHPRDIRVRETSHTLAAALSPQQRFTNFPPLSVRTEPNNCDVIHIASWCCRSKRGVTVHVMMMTSVVFFNVFPWCPPVNLNMYPLTVYNQSLNILESDKVTFFFSKLHNFIITSVKSMPYDSLPLGEGGCFQGESSLKSRLGGLIVAVIVFKTVNTTSQ